MSVRDRLRPARGVCVVRQGPFPLDVRVRREVAALVDAGLAVDVLCVARPGESRREVVDGARVLRLPVPGERRGGAAGYVARYAAFFVLAVAVVSVRHLWRRYRLVQVHSLPDVLVFAAAVPRLLGTPVVLDLHECMPEFFATKYGIDPDRWPVRLVARLEQGSIRFATAVLTCNEPMRQLFVGRGADADKVHVVLNSADESIFSAAPAPDRDDGRFVLVSHGTMEERYGLDTAVRATVLAAERVPGVRLELYGDGTCRRELEALVTELAAESLVSISDGFVPLPELLAALRRADAGIVAVKRDAFRDVTHCNKMFEFVVLGRPAIVSRTRSVEEYFDGSCFLLFEGGDVDELADAIVRLASDGALRARLVARARVVNEPYRWVHQRAAYLAVVDGLL